MKEEIKNIIEQGYKPFKFIKGEYVPYDKLIYTDYLSANFNVLEAGGIDIRFVKGNIMVILALTVKGQPPTLTWYRI